MFRNESQIILSPARIISRAFRLLMGASLVLIFCAGLAHAQTETITFDELPTQPVNGVIVKGVSFRYQVNGADSTSCTFNDEGPTGNSLYISNPCLVGKTAGVLTMTFATPTPTLHMGLALDLRIVVRQAFTIQLYDASSNLIGTYSVDAVLPPGVPQPENEFNYSGEPVSRAVITFKGSTLFAVDNLTFGRPQVVSPPTVQFTSPSYSANEGDGSAAVTVTRTGDESVPVTVDYLTTDGTAQQRTRYTTASGTLSFAAGETSKTFSVLVTDNAITDGSQTINLTLSNPSSGASLGVNSTALLTVNDNDAGTSNTNPSDGAQFFVRQHYLDFLNREADAGGLGYWSGQITQCAANTPCVNDRRVDVSNAFFYEQEFQETGAFVYRVYKAAFGQRPTYAQLVPDRSRVVGGAQLDASKNAFTGLFISRSAFTTMYPDGLAAEQFVDALNANTGASLTPPQRDALAGGLKAGTESRASVLRKVAENSTFIDREYNASFVLTQYFGYLRRDPEPGGFDFWLGQISRFPIRNVGAQHALVCSFITSREYQERFGTVATHTNRECPQ
ncbi:MAG TPA: Calx-beta domain-containing protein [Pyrinomonadaceae bacterium]|jgi:hypothetical protein